MVSPLRYTVTSTLSLWQECARFKARELQYAYERQRLQHGWTCLLPLTLFRCSPPPRCLILTSGRHQCMLSRRGDRLNTSSNELSQENEGNGCSVTSFWLHVSDLLSKAPGPGEQARRWLGWTRLRTSVKGRVWVCQSAPESGTFFDVLSAAFAWEKQSTCRTAWAVPRMCRCSYLYGHGSAIRPRRKVSIAGFCLPDCGGVSHP